MAKDKFGTAYKTLEYNSSGLVLPDSLACDGTLVSFSTMESAISQS